MEDFKGEELYENDILISGQYIQSPQCKHTAHLDIYGNLVLCVNGGFDDSHRFWSSTYHRKAGTYQLKLQDGDLVVSENKGEKKELWRSQKINEPKGPCKLVLLDDCNLVVLDTQSNNSIIWQSGSAHPRVWQIFLPDDTRVGRVSIPGTHNSKAHFGAVAVCQKIRLPFQLLDGIRYFDIRLRQVDGDLEIYHGPIYQHCNLQQTLEEVTSFLKDHPSEFILMRIRKEYAPKDTSKSFGESVDEFVNKFSDYIYEGTTMENVKVKHVRGRIVILRGFDSARFIRYREPFFTINDHWVVWLTFIGNKMKHIQSSFALANESTTGAFITYTSGSHRTIPGLISGKINKEVVDLLKQGQHNFVGIVAMDFYLLESIFYIVCKNSGCYSIWKNYLT